MVVYDLPLQDTVTAPVPNGAFSATDRLLKIHERRARLWGIDAPVQGQTEMTVRYELVGVDLEALT